MEASAVAQYLGSREEQIVQFDEWANVYFIQIKGFRPRFVSKKAVKEWATCRGCYGQYQRKYFDKNEEACPLSQSPVAKKEINDLQAIWSKIALEQTAGVNSPWLPSFAAQ